MKSFSTKGTVLVVVTMVVMMGLGVGAESALIHQPDWGVWTYLGEDLTLTCNHTGLHLQPNNFIRWELPSGEFLDRNTDKFILQNDKQGQVVNKHLVVRNVQDADSGVYLCHIYRTHAMQDKIGHIMRGLNLGLHLYREPFDQYEHGVLVGGCAAAALIFLLAAGCLIHKFRYRATPKTTDSHDIGNGSRHVTASRLNDMYGNVKGTELSTVVALDGGELDEGEVNRSYDRKGDEIATRM